MGAVTNVFTTAVVFFAVISSSQASTCTEYQGGKSTIFGHQVHWYTCCNNCRESNPYCNGITWQGGSSEEYCGNCGENTFGGRYEKQYNCQDCDTQEGCRINANDWDWPLLCWKWANSFSGCCKKATRSKKRQEVIDVNSTSFTFCGDTICQDDESPTSCPLDCCYQVNSNCTVSGCTPTCCGESSCCLEDDDLEEDDGSRGAILHAFSFFSLLLIMLIATLI